MLQIKVKIGVDVTYILKEYLIGLCNIQRTLI